MESVAFPRLRVSLRARICVLAEKDLRLLPHMRVGDTSMKVRRMRQKTGENANQTGTYTFDGYVDGTSTPAPTADEKKLPMKKGETLPPVKSSKKAAYWLI